MLSYPQDLVQFKLRVAKSEGIAVGRSGGNWLSSFVRDNTREQL